MAAAGGDARRRIETLRPWRYTLIPILFLLITVFLWGPASSRAAGDGFTWSGPAGPAPHAPVDTTAVAPLAAAPSAVPQGEPFPLLWKQHIGRSAAFAPVAVGRGILVATTEGKLRLLDAADGRKLWARKLRDPLEAAPVYSGFPEPRGRVFVAGDGSAGTLRGIDAATGKDLWAMRSLGPAVQLAGWKDRLFVLEKRGRIACRAGADGSELWAVRFGGWDPAGLLLDGSVLYALARDDSLTAIDANTGRKLWTTAPGGRFAAPPARNGGDLLLVTVDGVLSRVDPANGIVRGKDRRSGPQIVSPLALGKGVLTISTAGLVECRGFGIDAYSWHGDLKRAVRAPALAIGPLILVASSGGTLQAINAESGTPVWSLVHPGGFQSGPILSAETLVVATDRGEVYAYRCAQTGS